MKQLLISVESCGSPLSTRRVTRGLSCMRKIKLTKGKYALVDNEDYKWLNQWKWHFDRYAKRTPQKSDGDSPRNIRMHRVIFGVKDDEFVDHINQNKLDNRRKNLRIATKSQNNRNIKCKGYHLVRKTGKWRVQISINRKKYVFGFFNTEKQARRKYLLETKRLLSLKTNSKL